MTYIPFVSYPPSGESDGLVGWPSAIGVYSSSYDIWYNQGQHDAAAQAYFTGPGNNGDNHTESRLGAQGGGGLWTPGLFIQEYCQGWQTCPTYNSVPLVDPRAPQISPPPGPGPCTSQTLDANHTQYVCPSWPAPSIYHPQAVRACPDSMCAYNETRGSPNGADVAFWVSAFIQARAASYCGPTITNSSGVQSGQYRYYWSNIYTKQSVPGQPITFWLYNSWQIYAQVPLYEPPFAPNAGRQVCGWAC